MIAELQDRCSLCGGPRDDVGTICAGCRRDNIPAAPRELFVLEMQAPNGSWFPMFGDAYLDESEARRRQCECLHKTRVTVYRPVKR